MANVSKSVLGGDRRDNVSVDSRKHNMYEGSEHDGMVYYSQGYPGINFTGKRDRRFGRTQLEAALGWRLT